MLHEQCSGHDDRGDEERGPVGLDGGSRARTNNLRDVSARIPKNRVTVFTGVSGSGKSSLVFDTVAAEAQRLVNETYPSFVQNRLPRYPQPDVDVIDGLMFTTAVDQRRFTGNGRSTVGTASDIAPLLRVVFSRVGEPSAGYSPAYSFNDPSGMCPRCEGLGQVDDLDLDALFDRSLSLDGGAIRFPTFAPGTYRWKRYVHAGVLEPAKRLADYTAEERDTLLYADHVIDIGPGAGHHGGTVVYQGPPDGLLRDTASITGFYLRRAADGAAVQSGLVASDLGTCRRRKA